MPAEQQRFDDGLSLVEVDGEVKVPNTGVYAKPDHPHLVKWLIGCSEPFALMDNSGPVHPQGDSGAGDILPWWGKKPAKTRREQREINRGHIREARAILRAAIDRANMPKQLDLPTDNPAA